MPRRVAKPDKRGEPDALVWRNEASEWGFACAHCAMLQIFGVTRTQGHAMEQAAAHLWSTHSLAKTWIQHLDPAVANAVQLAMPIAVALHHVPDN